MELSNTFEVKAPIEEAWTKLTDLELIAPAMPGAQLEEVEGDEYRGTVKVKVGPITAKYKGTAKIVDKDDDAKMVIIDAKGRDTRGQGNANATITAQLTEAGADVTKVELVTDLTLTGKVAQFARGVLSDVSTKLIGQFVDNLESDVFAGGDKASTAAAQPQDEADEAGPAATDKTAEAKDTTGKAASTATDKTTDTKDTTGKAEPPATAKSTDTKDTTGKAGSAATTGPGESAADAGEMLSSASGAEEPDSKVAASNDDASSEASPGKTADTDAVDSSKPLDADSATGAAAASGTPSARATDATAAAPAGVRKINSPEAEAVDLLDSAGAPLAKRVLPALGLLALVLLIIRILRNRSSR